MKVVEPKILRGFRDFLPQEMLSREKMISVIKEVYESYGFVPLSTPALEYKEILLGYGEEASKQIYLFREPEGNLVGLRFDLTVPLSRVIAQYKELPRPFKRYQIQPVWRYDKPDPGRFREFIQFDIDTVGTDSMIADAEIISAMHDCLMKLGLEFRIRFSNRKVLNSLINFANIEPSMAYVVFKVIDKLEKQGLENVKLELGSGRVDASGAEVQGLGLNKSQIAKIEEFLRLPQQTRSEATDSLEVLFQDVQEAEEGIRELKEIDEYLDALQIFANKVIIDLSIARGLDYYTGPVFEAILTNEQVASFGSVMGGGRFDQLIEHFTGVRVPATGASIGVDRLFSAMEKLKLNEAKPSTADVLVTIMVKDKVVEYQKIAQKLRLARIKTELYMGAETSLGNQLKYADKQLIPIAVIIGSDEFSRNQVSIKDLRMVKKEKLEIKDRETWLKDRIGQKTVPIENLVEEIKHMLRQGG
jgi:histidyl-tRNA synthetase